MRTQYTAAIPTLRSSISRTTRTAMLIWTSTATVQTPAQAIASMTRPVSKYLHRYMCRRVPQADEYSAIHDRVPGLRPRIRHRRSQCPHPHLRRSRQRQLRVRRRRRREVRPSRQRHQAALCCRRRLWRQAGVRNLGRRQRRQAHGRELDIVGANVLSERRYQW
jgi:hypothetical protein